MSELTGNEEVVGYCKKRYTLNELKNLCPPKDKIKQCAEKYESEKSEFFNVFNNTDEESLPNETWVQLSQKNWTCYSVSNLGRVKINKDGKDHILKLMNEKLPNGEEHQGYLIFDKQYAEERQLRVGNNYHIWNLIAMGFLGRPPFYPRGEELHVHHIDNNGYNCRPENLILLTPEQHNFVHWFSCDYQNKSDENYRKN